MTATVDNAVADLQRANAELQRRLDEALAERDEALEQQTATAEVLQVINSSPGDLAPVFDAMLEKALRLCDSAFGVMHLCENGRFRPVATRGVPVAFAAYKTEAEDRHGPGGAHARLLRGAPFVHIHDLKDEEAYCAGEATRRAVVDLGGARTAIVVPLRKDGAFLGSFVVYRQEVRPFSDKQIALLQSFAAQAVIAIENARLLGELRSRTADLQQSLEYQTATSDVLKVISQSAFDLQPVLDTLVQTAVGLCRAAWGLLHIRDGEVYRPAATFGLEPEREAFARAQVYTPGNDTPTGRAALEGKVVHTPNMAADPDYASAPGARYGNVGAVLAVPLLREGQPLGVIALVRPQPEPFNEQEIELVCTFADQAVIAMENARLITETREALDQQTATAEVLQVINSSPGDLAPVFDAMLEKAMRLCGGAFGMMLARTGEQVRTVAASGVLSAFAEFRRTNVVPRAPGSIAARIFAGEAIVHKIDLKDDELYRSGDPQRRALVDLGGARTSLVVALRKGEEVLGAIHLYRQEVRAFSEKQIALLQSFAAQAVIAIENARLLGELRQRTEEVAELNRGLETRIAEQVEELGRVGRRALNPWRSIWLRSKVNPSA